MFRTWSLLSVGVLPLYVVEGQAPDLKHATIRARNTARAGGSSAAGGGCGKSATRKRFNSVLKEVSTILTFIFTL